MWQPLAEPGSFLFNGCYVGLLMDGGTPDPVTLDNPAFRWIQIEEARIQLPLQGFWMADVRAVSNLVLDNNGNQTQQVIQTPEDAFDFGLYVGNQVFIVLSGYAFIGSVYRTGIYAGALHVRVTGAPAALMALTGTLPNTLPASQYQGATPYLLMTRYGSAVQLPWVTAALDEPYNGPVNPTESRYQALQITSGNITIPGGLNVAGVFDTILRWVNTSQNEQLRNSLNNQQITRQNMTPLYHWRVTPDQFLWAGLDFYQSFPSPLAQPLDPVADLTGNASQPNDDLTNNDIVIESVRPETGEEIYGVTQPILLPGDTYLSPVGSIVQTESIDSAGILSVTPNPEGNVQPSLATAVEYWWRSSKLRMIVWNDSASIRLIQ